MNWSLVLSSVCCFGLFMILGFTLGNYNDCLSNATTASIVEQPRAPSKPDPVCIHEACSERPGWLECTTRGSDSCVVFRIVYEHHCHCDTWAPAPTDGGAAQ